MTYKQWHKGNLEIATLTKCKKKNWITGHTGWLIICLIIVPFDFVSKQQKETKKFKPLFIPATSNSKPTTLFVMLNLSFLSFPTECGGELNAPSGTISSPNYPNLYPHSRVCRWELVVSPDRRITLTINDLRLEGSDTSCIFDYVDVSPFLPVVLIPFTWLKPQIKLIPLKCCGISDSHLEPLKMKLKNQNLQHTCNKFICVIFCEVENTEKYFITFLMGM